MRISLRRGHVSHVQRRALRAAGSNRRMGCAVIPKP
jgi:hypothetical protein